MQNQIILRNINCYGYTSLILKKSNVSHASNKCCNNCGPLELQKPNENSAKQSKSGENPGNIQVYSNLF